MGSVEVSLDGLSDDQRKEALEEIRKKHPGAIPLLNAGRYERSVKIENVNQSVARKVNDIVSAYRKK